MLWKLLAHFNDRNYASIIPASDSNCCQKENESFFKKKSSSLAATIVDFHCSQQCLRSESTVRSTQWGFVCAFLFSFFLFDLDTEKTEQAFYLFLLMYFRQCPLWPVILGKGQSSKSITECKRVSWPSSVLMLNVWPFD